MTTIKTASGYDTRVDTSYRRIQQNEPLWVIKDFGNKDIKAMIHANFGEEIWFPNCVCELNSSEYANQEAVYKTRPADYEQSSLFSLDGQGVVVGDLATNMSNSQRRMGAQKYGVYMRYLFVASMLHLYPDGHKKINLVVTHPAKLPVTELESLKGSFEGAMHVKTVDGRSVDYLVKNVLMIEEPIAAFQTYALTVKGTGHQRRNFKLDPDTQFAIADVGGFLSHLALGRVNRKGRIEIAAVNLEPIEYGIHHVVKSFEQIARNQIPELSKLQSLPIERVNEALKTDGYRIRNQAPINVESIVNEAFYPLLTQFRSTYEQNPFRAGAGLDGVILTAGGNALAGDYLTRNLFGDGFAFPSEDDPETMRYSAIRGASKGLIPFLAEQDYQRMKQRG